MTWQGFPAWFLKNSTDNGVIRRFIVTAQQTFNAVAFCNYRSVVHFDQWVNEGWLCLPICDDLMKIVNPVLYLIRGNDGVCRQRRWTWPLCFAVSELTF